MSCHRPHTLDSAGHQAYSTRRLPILPLRPEQQIYEDGAGTQLWDICDVAAHFALEVGGGCMFTLV